MTTGRAAAFTRSWLVVALLVLTGGCEDDPTGASQTCLEAPALVPGEGVEGRLTPRDPLFLRAHIDYYSLDLADSTTIRATMTSEEFDPFLYRLAPGPRVLDQAFDSAGAPPGEPETAVLHARLGPGCHMLGASSWERDTTGGYTLRADTVPPDHPGNAD